MLRSISILLLALPLLAQTGQIGGRVLDPSGAPVPAAQIKIRNTANGSCVIVGMGSSSGSSSKCKE